MSDVWDNGNDWELCRYIVVTETGVDTITCAYSEMVDGTVTFSRLPNIIVARYKNWNKCALDAVMIKGEWHNV